MPCKSDVIIISYAKNKELQNITQTCLDSLLNSETNVQPIIIENNKNITYNCLTIHPNFDFNYNACINLGINYCDSDIITFCNNDVIFTPGWLTSHIKVFDNNDLLSLSPKSPGYEKQNHMTSGLYLGYTILEHVAGWCITIKRNVLDFIGKLDTSVDFWYSDYIYIDQIKKHKIKHALNADSIVYHLFSKTMSTILTKDKLYDFTKGQKRKYEKAQMKYLPKIYY